MASALSLLDGDNKRADDDFVGSLLVDLSELEVSYSLLEDIRCYLGENGLYTMIPRLFDLCIRTLKSTERFFLTERDNREDLDKVYDEIEEMFDERKFKRAVHRHNLSVVMTSFCEKVTDYLYDIWELMYTEVSKYIKDKFETMGDVMGLTFMCDVSDLKTISGYDGYTDTIRETSMVLDIKSMIELSSNLLKPGSYND